jgi:hypothetical protein
MAFGMGYYCFEALSVDKVALDFAYLAFVSSIEVIKWVAFGLLLAFLSSFSIFLIDFSNIFYNFISF